jgi:polar amino acid transport system substrate-binding protein
MNNKKIIKSKINKIFIYICVLLVSVCTSVFAASSKKVIRVGTNATHPPFTFTDDKTSKIIGHDIELITKILTNLGYEVQYDNMNFDGLIPSVVSKKIDVISCALSVNPERAKNVLFTDTYYKGGTRIAVLKDNNSIKSFDDLKDKTVGVELGTVQAQIAHDNSDKIGKIVEYNSEEIFVALKTKKVDATISDEAIASYLINNSKVVDAKFVGEPMKERGMAFALNKKDKKLANEINKELTNLKKNGWYDENYKKWFGEK